MLAVLAAATLASSAVAASPVDEQRDEVEQITSELERLEREAATLAEDHIDALAAKDQLDAEIAEIERRLGDQQSAVDDLREELTLTAVHRFTGSGTNELGFLLASDESQTTELQRGVLTAVALDTGNVTTDDLEFALTELQDTQADLSGKRARAESLAAEIEEAREANEQKQVEYQQARSQAEAELGDLIREEEERRARESYEQLQRDQQAVSRAIPAPAPAPAPVPAGTGQPSTRRSHTSTGSAARRGSGTRKARRGTGSGARFTIGSSGVGFGRGRHRGCPVTARRALGVRDGPARCRF